MKTVLDDLIYDLIDYLALLLHRTKLHDVCDHVVPKLIRGQFMDMFKYHVHYLTLDLVVWEPLNDPLYDSTTVFVLAQPDHQIVLGNKVHQVERLARWHMSEDLLNHMVATLIKERLQQHLLL